MAQKEEPLGMGRTGGTQLQKYQGGPRGGAASTRGGGVRGGFGAGPSTACTRLLFPFIPCLCVFPFSLKRGFLSYFGLAFRLLSFIILI